MAQETNGKLKKAKRQAGDLSTRTRGKLDDLLKVIAKSIADKGYAPSIRDLAKLTRVSNTTVVLRLRKLQELGAISKPDRLPRCITVHRDSVGV